MLFYLYSATTVLPILVCVTVPLLVNILLWNHLLCKYLTHLLIYSDQSPVIPNGEYVPNRVLE